MPSPRKTFDKADLLTFLTETDDEAAVGSFTVIRPSPTLFGETENSTHEVQAIPEAFWCERYQLDLVTQRVRVTGAGANALRTALIAAWREHGIERTPGGQGDGGTVTAQGALQRLCWN